MGMLFMKMDQGHHRPVTRNFKRSSHGTSQIACGENFHLTTPILIVLTLLTQEAYSYIISLNYSYL